MPCAETRRARECRAEPRSCKVASTTFGRLRRPVAWQSKKSTGDVSNPHIEALYAEAMAAGALGGKLLGAGRAGTCSSIARRRSVGHIRRSSKGPEGSVRHCGLRGPGVSTWASHR